MHIQKQSLINTKLFIGAVAILLLGYVLMALVSIESVRMTLSPIIIVFGFVLVVMSIIIPSKK